MKKKLELNKKTLQVLTADEIKAVAGGDGPGETTWTYPTDTGSEVSYCNNCNTEPFSDYCPTWGGCTSGELFNCEGDPSAYCDYA